MNVFQILEMAKRTKLDLSKMRTAAELYDYLVANPDELEAVCFLVVRFMKDDEPQGWPPEIYG